MTTIKVECGCGQHYAFDVDPNWPRMPQPVACPTCGVDGTSAANEALAQHRQPQVAVAVAAPAFAPALRVPGLSRTNAPSAAETVEAPSAAAPAAARPRLLPGQVERPQAQSEARAKIFWGDPPEEVVKFLMRNNFSHDEASELVAAMC